VNPSGASPGVPPDMNTNVRMVSEKVDLTIEAHKPPTPAGEENSAGHWMRGRVKARFLMRNLSQEREAFDVWFPLAASVRYSGILPSTPENIVKDFEVWVEDRQIKTKKVKAPDLSDPQQESMWAKFPLVFPAGEDVIVQVNYTIYPSGRSPFGGFEYILQTGAGWKDSIGEAIITISLPDAVTPENVSLSGNSIEGLPLAPQPPGYKIEQNTVRWQFTNLEPTAQHNIYVDVLQPDRYQRLLQARAGAQNEPNSADAQLELAGAIQDALLVIYVVGQHGGGPSLAEQANVAYRRSLELAPNRADIYRQYARWLVRIFGRTSLMSGFCPQELCDLMRRGLESFPDDPELIKIDEEIRMALAEGAPFATQAALTATQNAASLTDLAYSATQGAINKTSTVQASSDLSTRQAARPAPTLASSTPTTTRLLATATSTHSPTIEISSTVIPANAQERPGGLFAVAVLLIGSFVVVLIIIGKRRGVF
jgi:hypothetical protein